MFAESNPDGREQRREADCISAANNGVNVDIETPRQGRGHNILNVRALELSN